MYVDVIITQYGFVRLANSSKFNKTYPVIPDTYEIFIRYTRYSNRARIKNGLVGNTFHIDCHIRRDIRLRVLSIVNLKTKMISTIVRTRFHIYHASIFVELKLCMFEAFPIKLFVWQVPIVQIVDVDSTYLGIG